MTPPAAASWVRYLYYMRFALLLWLFAPFIALLNEIGGKTLTSGILVPETWEQYTCVSFFIVSSGFVALIIARVVVINGKDRFEVLTPPKTPEKKPAEKTEAKPEVLPAAAALEAPHVIVAECRAPDIPEPVPEPNPGPVQLGEIPNSAAPPAGLTNLLNDCAGKHEGHALIVALIPTLLTFGYLVFNGCREGVQWWIAILGLVVGSLLATAFWTVVNVLYYLMYELPSDVDWTKVELGTNAARTILFSRSFLRLPLPDEAVRLDTIETASLPLKEGPLTRLWNRCAERLVNSVGMPGYVYYGTSRLYEAQFFSLVAVFGFILLYLVMWPLTAPVPTAFAWVALAVLMLAGALVIRVLLIARKPDNTRPQLIPTSIGIAIAFTLVFPLLYIFSDAERFPTFAGIMLAMTMFLWILGGIAFFLDRFRVPVFTLILVIMILPRLLHLDFGREEHYFSIATVPQPLATLPTPAEILQQWITDKNHPFDPDQPVVIVTATGGGLHASAWTAAVLAQLEAQFQHDRGESLYSHVLLLSTVSGGSTGVMSYLQTLRTPGADPASAEISAGCSSLEAVGWGVIYHDFPAALFLPLDWVFGPSSGIGDLDRSPLFTKDRTWTLRKGFERNLNDQYCTKVWQQDPKKQLQLIGLSDEQQGIAQAKQTMQSLTLRNLIFAPRTTPAFTMNTTTSEGGDRFLLANYGVPQYAIGADEALPAKSFLQFFGATNVASGNQPALYPDLPLATAAQLSATFPYVSSAARFPGGRRFYSPHFIDGGYYDNDGTASVLEFLRYALDDPKKPAQQKDPTNAAALQLVDNTYRAQSKHLRIILIEIRNSNDDPADLPTYEPDSHARSTPDNLLFQLLAPLSGFWNAGHISVTARNRAALDLIEKAYADRLQVQHIVIADKLTKKVDGTDPLNWSLTPAQRNEVRSSVCDPANQLLYKQAADWSKPGSGLWDNPANNPSTAAPTPSDSCKALNSPKP